MALKPTGGVVEHIGRYGRTYRALRFTACGKRRFESLGPVREGDAQRALRYVLDDVERGIWRQAGHGGVRRSVVLCTPLCRTAT